MDPPEYRTLRGVVGRAFTRRAAAALQLRLAEIAESPLAGVPGDESDLIVHLAHPLPVVRLFRPERII
ncbi:hypothetical protein [Lentzea pudingi]|nr:hypothetical protein [Lentzea pudingi]